MLTFDSIQLIDILENAYFYLFLFEKAAQCGA